MKRISDFKNKHNENDKHEIDVYDLVYDFYDGKCILTGDKLSRGYAYMYPHLFPKGSYPKFKYNPRNIVLVGSSDLHIIVDRIFHRLRQDLGKYQLMGMIESGEDLSILIKEYYDKQ